VCDATSHRGLKIRKSARGTPEAFDFAVRTQKMEGSMWSLEILPTFTNFSMAYCSRKAVRLLRKEYDSISYLVRHVTDHRDLCEFIFDELFDEHTLTFRATQPHRKVYVPANTRITGRRPYEAVS